MINKIKIGEIEKWMRLKETIIFVNIIKMWGSFPNKKNEQIKKKITKITRGAKSQQLGAYFK